MHVCTWDAPFVSTFYKNKCNYKNFLYNKHAKLSRLDGEHVVFGKVIEGMDAVYAIEGGAGTYSGKPRKKVIIADSGEIPKSEWEEGSRGLAGAS